MKTVCYVYDMDAEWISTLNHDSDFDFDFDFEQNRGERSRAGAQESSRAKNQKRTD
jgi:hypothetical protein